MTTDRMIISGAVVRKNNKLIVTNLDLFSLIDHDKKEGTKIINLVSKSQGWM